MGGSIVENMQFEVDIVVTNHTQMSEIKEEQNSEQSSPVAAIREAANEKT